jgi:predicted Rossmann fold nucleotide-binding protein DprA/Smf involved in DNA uptake
MALGNDSVATAGTIAAGGTTVAVLGSGIDVIYPREHETLFEAILQNGAVLTEYPPATPPAGQHFPVRNRIISGLSQGTVVVECDQRSGALITARTAILQGRDIYAFPGNVGQTTSAGSNRLISDGAVVVMSARDVLENYAFLYRDTLHMDSLRTSELRSEPNEAFLEELGVCVREKEDGERSEPPRRSSRPHTSAQEPSRAPVKSPIQSGAEERPIPAAPRRESPRKAPKPSERLPDAEGTRSPHGDASGHILQKLTDTQRRIFEALPLDHAVPVDAIVREGFSAGEVMAAMTVLEIRGLIVSLPGGLYSRK